jgi:putative transposase
MQVFGLPGHVIRSGRAASRLLAAQTPTIEAAKRRDAVARWRRAMAAGLGAVEAARAVGVPRATLYRWQAKPEPGSRRPRRPRQPHWPHALVAAIEALRLHNPMWGMRKLARLLKRQGSNASISTVGRILRRLLARGAVIPVPVLRRRPAHRRFRVTPAPTLRPPPRQGPQGRNPGELVQMDTLLINIRPDKPIRHFTAPVAKWTCGGRDPGLRDRRQNLARQTHRHRALPRQRRPGRWRLRVHVRLRGPLPRQANRTRRAAAQAPRPQRVRRARPIDLAIRILRILRPAKPHRCAPALVDAFAHRFNHYRPHQSLGDRTPAEYLASISPENAESHMM